MITDIGMTFLISQKFVKQNRLTVWAFVCLFYSTALSGLPVNASDLESATQAATNALPRFLRLENINTYPPGWTIQAQSAPGFPAINKRVFLGTPFETYSLSLKDVESFNSTSSVLSLLKPTTKSIFPVTDGKSILGGIDVDKVGADWKPTKYSTTGLIQDLSSARDEVATSSSTNTTGPFLVQMKSLNLQFLGFYGTNGDLLLRPLNSYPDVTLDTNTNYKAETVLEKLAPKARHYNGLPQ